MFKKVKKNSDSESSDDMQEQKSESNLDGSDIIELSGSEPLPEAAVSKKAKTSASVGEKWKSPLWSQNIVQFLPPRSGDEVGLAYVQLLWLEDLSDLTKKEIKKCRKCDAYIDGLSCPDKHQDVWVCQFCGKKNPLEGSDYVPEQSTTLTCTGVEIHSSSHIVLCVDTSSAMNSYHPPKEGKKPVTLWAKMVGRVSDLLDTVEKIAPDAVVGVVLFGDELTILGDCTEPPVILPMYYPFDRKSTTLSNDRQEIADRVAKAHMQVTIKAAKANILETLYAVVPEGHRPLGPALWAASKLLGGFKDSRIFLFTSGEGDVGLGNIAEKKEHDKFYDEMSSSLEKSAIRVVVHKFGLNKTECSGPEHLQGFYGQSPVRVSCRTITGSESDMNRSKVESVSDSTAFFSYERTTKGRGGWHPVQVQIRYSLGGCQWLRVVTDRLPGDLELKSGKYLCDYNVLTEYFNSVTKPVPEGRSERLKKATQIVIKQIRAAISVDRAPKPNRLAKLREQLMRDIDDTVDSSGPTTASASVRLTKSTSERTTRNSNLYNSDNEP